jgi:toxin ParE1/3/4
MKMKYRKKALADLEDIFSYLYERNPKAAKDTMIAIESAVKLILQMPLLFPLVGLENMRVKLLSQYPYKIFYRVMNNEIVIHRIYHTARLNPYQP